MCCNTNFTGCIGGQNIFKNSEFLMQNKNIICNNIDNKELLENIIEFVEYSNTRNKIMKLKTKDKLNELIKQLQQQKIET